MGLGPIGGMTGGMAGILPVAWEPGAWIPSGIRTVLAAPQHWGEYAPLEFFLGLVLLVGAVLLVCALLGIAHALALRLTLFRVEALGPLAETVDLAVLKEDFVAAFRISRRLRRLAQSYADSLQTVRRRVAATMLVSPCPAKDILSLEALAPAIGKMRSERLLTMIIGLGGLVILVELGVGLLRFHAELVSSGGTNGIAVLVDPAMSGAIFALGCVLLTAVSVGVHRGILRLVQSNLARLQAAMDGLFYHPGLLRTAEAPLRDRTPPTAPPRPEAEPPPRPEAGLPDPVRGAIASAVRPPTPGLRTVPTESPQPAATAPAAVPGTDFARTAEEIRLLVGLLSEDVTSQRRLLGEVLARLDNRTPKSEPLPEIAQLRESTGELMLLADATRESISQLAQVIESLSRIVATLVEHAQKVATGSAAQGASLAPDVLNELRELLRETDGLTVPAPDPLDSEAAPRT